VRPNQRIGHGKRVAGVARPSEQGSVCTFSKRMVTSADKEDVAS
jgi:hypothetical protein